MTSLLTLLDIACGRPFPSKGVPEDAGPAHRYQLVVLALLSSLAFAAMWGAAAGSRTTALAIANLYKVPMVVLLSCAFAAPAGLLSWRLSGTPIRGIDFALGLSSGIFGGTLVLAALAPLVALYYHSSAWAGPMLAMGSAGAALVTGTLMFVRGTLRRLPEGASKLATLVPVSVTLVMMLLTLLQLAAIAAPIFPELTPFSGGIDQLTR